VIPALAAVVVGPCRDWCAVRFGDLHGVAPATVLAAGGAPPAFYGSAGADKGPLGLSSSLFGD
jgi:hypothetical protein